MPEGTNEGILRGMYLLKEAEGDGECVHLLGSGSILRESIAAADLLRDDFQVSADVWSVTSFTELRREGMDVERWNTLHPHEPQRVPYVTEQLSRRAAGPVVASTDYMAAYADQIRAFVPAHFRTLGTDGFGRSDGREQLRHHFEVDRRWIVVAALTALCGEGRIPPATVQAAIEKYGIDPEKPNPVGA